jgi:copper oxidase (laccase) domain-containing protein
VRNERGRYFADLYGLARRVLESAGVGAVHGGGWCTHRDAERFFSFRRDGVTGRMATLAWLA